MRVLKLHSIMLGGEGEGGGEVDHRRSMPL